MKPCIMLHMIRSKKYINSYNKELFLILPRKVVFMNQEKLITKNGEELTTFNESTSKRTPIQTALTLPLVSAVGKCFLLISGNTEEVQDPNDESKTIPRAVYVVRVVSQNTKLPVGTMLTVKVKGAKSIITDDENKKMMLGVAKSKVVAFDELSHWMFNGNEGLSASGIRTLDVSPEEAMKL